MEGLKVKYNVYKAHNNELVEDCFVLRPQKDLAARKALLIYAGKTKNKALRQDILEWLKSIRKNYGTLEEFDEIVKPVQEWLNNSGCPHHTIIIDCNGARFVSDVMGVPNNDNL